MMIYLRRLALIAGVCGWLALLIVLGLLIAATFIGQGVLTARVIGLIFVGKSWQAAAPPMFAILAPVIVRAALQWSESVGAKMMAVAIKERLRTRLYAHLLDLGVGYLARERTGAVQATLVDGVQHLEGYLTRYIPQCFVALIAPIPIIAFLYLSGQPADCDCRCGVHGVDPDCTCCIQPPAGALWAASLGSLQRAQRSVSRCVARNDHPQGVQCQRPPRTSAQ